MYEYGNDTHYIHFLVIATCSPTCMHPLISSYLYLLFTPSTHTGPRIPFLPLSKQRSVTLSIQYNSPHGGAISAACLHRDPITFLLNVSYKWRNDKTKMCGVYLKKGSTGCHGWLNWDSTSHTHLITNKKWTLQIHRFAIKHLQVSVHFYCFGSFTRGNDNACIKRLRSADIRPQVIPFD